MNFYEDGLTKSQETVLREMGALMAERRFYLAGGTALAIYFGHRRSVDIDWFTSERFADPMLFAQQLRDQDIPFTTDQTAPGTLHGHVHGVRVSLLEFRYPLLNPLVQWAEQNCLIASQDDLGCMKLSAITQRGSKKDFVDLYALGAHHRPLGELLYLYQKKFSVSDIGHVLYALVYFDDADREPMPSMLWDVSWSQVKKTIIQWAREASQQL